MKLTRREVPAALAVPVALTSRSARSADEPLSVGFAGLVHGHIGGFIKGLLARNDMRLVGVAEADTELARRILTRHAAQHSPLFADVRSLLAVTARADC